MENAGKDLAYRVRISDGTAVGQCQLACAVSFGPFLGELIHSLLGLEFYYAVDSVALIFSDAFREIVLLEVLISPCVEGGALEKHTVNELHKGAFSGLVFADYQI